MNLSRNETAFCLMATAACVLRLQLEPDQIFHDKRAATIFKGVLLRNNVTTERATMIVRDLFGVIRK